MRAALLASLLLLVPLSPRAQEAALLATDSPAYEWIERLQRRGLLLDLSPTVSPYRHGDLRRALDAADSLAVGPVERRWLDAVRRALPPPPAPEATTARLEIGGGTFVTNNERLEPVRWTDAEDAVVQAGGANVYPNAILRASLAHGPLVAQFGARVDVFYEDDPDGLDIVNKSIFLRNQEGYVGAAGRWADVYLGAVGRHWGLPSGDGLFLSGNPRPFDALAVRLGGERLSVRAVAGELDAATADGRFTGRVGDQSREVPLRRFLVAHRIDWRPARWLALAGVETMLSSGAGAGWSLASLLPTSFYSFLNDGPPVNQANNGMVGGMLWVQRGRATVAGQLTMDDFDLFNSAEPTSLALTGQLAVAALARGRADATLDLTLVTARTYNTFLPEQTYVFALRGIGTQFNDFVHARMGADVYLDDVAPGLWVRPEMQALWQGEADLREPYPSNSLPTILVGEVERTLRAGVKVRWAPSPTWWLRADVGVNRTTSDGWQVGRDMTRFVGLVEAGARWSFGGRFSPHL